MLFPKKTKYRKAHKLKNLGKATSMTSVDFGDHGLKTLESSWITARQIEAARKVMTRYTRKGGKIWIRIFPDMPITKKGGEIPMGKGKGPVDHYIAAVKAGTVMFEMGGISEEMSREAMNLAAYKLPVKCKIVNKN